MSPPPRDQAEIDARNQFAAFMQGWKCGAVAGMPDKRATEHTNLHIRAAYNHGYSSGATARGSAMSQASEEYGYELSPLRGTDA